MELHNLCEAAITGVTGSLHKIVEEDPLILHKVSCGCFNGAASPLHVATSSGQTEFLKAILSLKPELELGLTEVLDSQLRSALHLASAMGHDEIANVLLKANPEMCFKRDREGKNPLHVAAVKGKINVLKELVRARPQAARERVDRNETILHLCVKHNQLESLKKLLEMIQDRDFVNAKDSDGNTILHLAILYYHVEIASHVLGMKTIDVNAKNASGNTAMDIFSQVHAGPDQTESNIEDLLLQTNAKQAKDLVGSDWLMKKRDCLMVVASLIATMAFQAAVNPPGGVWQENSDNFHHRAGEAVMAYNYEDSYPYFLRFNTIGFVASLSTILLLISGLKFRNKATMWVLMVTMWLAITSVAITFAFANVVVTPKKDRRSLSHTIKIGVIVWSGVMSLLLLMHTVNLVRIFVKEKRSRMKAIKMIVGFKPQSSQIVRSLGRVKDGGGTYPPPLPHNPSMC